MPYTPNWQFDYTERPAALGRWLEVNYAITTHTRGYNVARFFKLRRPNESPENYRYRILNYQKLTLGSWMQAEDKLARILSTHKFKFSGSDYLYDWLDGNNSEGYEYFSWWRNKIIRRALEDPNGWLTWIPKTPNSPAEKVELRPYAIQSIYVLANPEENNNDHITFCMPELTYKFGNKNQYIQMLYWTIDREWFWKHEQIDVKGEKRWVSTPVYRHGLGMLPIAKIKGIATSANCAYDVNVAKVVYGSNFDPLKFGVTGSAEKETLLVNNSWNTEFPLQIDFYDSWFAGFVPFANQALQHFGDAEAALLQCGYPTRIEEISPCPANGCVNGKVWVSNAEGQQIQSDCPTCQGHGVMLPNPLGKYIRARYPAKMDDKPYATDPISILRGVPEDVKVLFDQAFADLDRAKLDVWLKDQDKVMSDKGVEAGNDGFKSQVKKISESFYSTMELHLYFFELLTHGSSPIVIPEIEPPLDFEIRTEEEIINTLTTLSDSGASTSTKIKLEKDLCKMMNNGKDDAGRLIDIKVMWDVFYGQNSSEITAAIMNGAMNPVLQQKHSAIDSIIQRILSREGEDWIWLPDETVLSDLDSEFAKLSLSAPAGTLIP